MLSYAVSNNLYHFIYNTIRPQTPKATELVRTICDIWLDLESGDLNHLATFYTNETQDNISEINNIILSILLTPVHCLAAFVAQDLQEIEAQQTYFAALCVQQSGLEDTALTNNSFKRYLVTPVAAALMANHFSTITKTRLNYKTALMLDISNEEFVDNYKQKYMDILQKVNPSLEYSCPCLPEIDLYSHDTPISTRTIFSPVPDSRATPMPGTMDSQSLRQVESQASVNVTTLFTLQALPEEAQAFKVVEPYQADQSVSSSKVVSNACCFLFWNPFKRMSSPTIPIVSNNLA